MHPFILMKSSDSDQIELIARDDHHDFELIQLEDAEDLAKQILTLYEIDEEDEPLYTMQLPLKWQEDDNGYYFVVAEQVHLFMQNKILQKIKLVSLSRKVILEKNEALDLASILMHFSAVVEKEIIANLEDCNWGLLMQVGRNSLIRDSSIVMLYEESEFASAFLYLVTNYPERLPEICCDHGEKISSLFSAARILNENSIPSIFDRLHQSEIDLVESLLQSELHGLQIIDQSDRVISDDAVDF